MYHINVREPQSSPSATVVTVAPASTVIISSDTTPFSISVTLESNVASLYLPVGISTLSFPSLSESSPTTSGASQKSSAFTISVTPSSEATIPWTETTTPTPDGNENSDSDSESRISHLSTMTSPLIGGLISALVLVMMVSLCIWKRYKKKRKVHDPVSDSVAAIPDSEQSNTQSSQRSSPQLEPFFLSSLSSAPIVRRVRAEVLSVLEGPYSSNIPTLASSTPQNIDWIVEQVMQSLRSQGLAQSQLGVSTAATMTTADPPPIYQT